MKTALVILTGFLLISAQQFYAQSVEEDVIYFKDGNIKRGVVTEISSKGMITVRTNAGTLREYKLAEIDSVIKRNKKSIETGKRTSENQTFKGVFSIGGSVQYSKVNTREVYEASSTRTYTINEYDYTYLGICPSIGYFMFDNFSLNFAINYEKYERDGYDYGGANYAIYADYYLAPSANKVFISAGVLFRSDFDINEAYSGIFVGGGYNIAVAKNISLQPILRYTSFSPEDKRAGDLSSTVFGIGIKTFIY